MGSAHTPGGYATRTGRAWLPLLALLVLTAPAEARSRLTVSAARLDAGGMAFVGLGAQLAAAGSGGLKVSLQAESIDGAPGLGRLLGPSFSCPDLTVSATRLACDRGKVSGDFGPLGQQDAALAFAIGNAGAARFRLAQLALGGGKADIAGSLVAGSWTADASVVDLRLGQMEAIPAARERLPHGMHVDGMLSGQVTVAGRGPYPVSASAKLDISGLGLADAAGTLAGEQLHGQLDARIQAAAAPAGGWRATLRLAADSGQAYLEPVFLDLGQHELELEAEVILPESLGSASVGHFDLQQSGVGRLAGSAELDLAGESLLRRARVRLESLDVAGFAGVYARPFLISTPFADLAGSGIISGEVDVDAGSPSRLQLELGDVTLDSPAGALSVSALTGHFSWFDEQLRNELAPQADSELFKSSLQWQSARLWGIEFGPVTIPFTTTGPNFRLLDPIEIPVFDGRLAIETLRIRHAGTPQMYLRFDAELKPVSIAPLARALGWPEFSGTLSGRIPRLELADGLVTLGGNIEARAFDGTITLRGLRLRDPLGRHPQLLADIEVDSLNLERLTDTFEFGLITGRLSGKVASLETFDWMPTAFDASFFSTPGDRSPHRISQRAVSNLSSIGGGSGGSVTAAMQSGFLRFFKNFHYDRLGLSCRLVNDVCMMDGVAPAPGGYYIVKGKGLPRIDVIASQRRVAWTRLVRQLAAITQTSGPVVE
jgi:hypothetical protein